MGLLETSEIPKDVHGRDILHSKAFLDERDDHLELATLTRISCIGYRDRRL